MIEGNKAFSEYQKTLKPEDVEKLKKNAEEINKVRQKQIKKYEIPTFEHKDFNSFLRKLRADKPDIPLKKDMTEK